MIDSGSGVPDLNALTSRLRLWGRCRVVSQLEGGHRNAVFLVERNGERLVAKTTRRTPSAIACLAHVQQRAAEAGFVIPFLVPSERGQLVESGITVEKWIEGSSASQERLVSSPGGTRICRSRGPKRPEHGPDRRWEVRSDRLRRGPRGHFHSG